MISASTIHSKKVDVLANSPKLALCHFDRREKSGLFNALYY